MFCLDIETVGLESNSAVLSLAMAYYDPSTKIDYKKILSETFFVKFDLNIQLKEFGRTYTQSSLDWWRKQSEAAKICSLLPSESDVHPKQGIADLRKWFNGFPDAKKQLVWVRGSLDQPVVESLFRSLDEEPLVMYNAWRDVRTALDCFYPNSTNGYVEVDPAKCLNYDHYAVVKHDPRHDVVFDLCQLFAGKSE